MNKAEETESISWADTTKKIGLYLDHLRIMADAYSDEHTHEYLLAQAVAQAKEEGKKEGKEEGKEEMAEEMARNLLAIGISPDVIKQSSGLSVDKIRALMN